ncbi:hypothetical protein GXW82_29945 [Streptacidiphilus sp. 4-A2]|nr:hypothetical protein [Streptacidiphilus sp. 4-A2]
MSINRAVVALGAVAVVGVATLGFSIPYAVHAGKPVPNVAVTVGSTWTQMAPADKSCYNGGNVLTAKQKTACSAAVQKLLTSGKVKTITIPSTNSNYAVNVDQLIADKGWFAGGENGSIVAPTKNAYAGNLPATPVLTSTSQTTGGSTLNNSGPVLVVEGGTNSSSAVYGEWLFQLKVKGS